MLDNNINFHRIEPQFYDIAKDCGKISQKYIKQLYSHQTNYHLFAADIICDTNYQCHLLEINNGGIGTEMNDLLPKMCPRGGSLHNTEIINKLFQDMVDVVLEKGNYHNSFKNLSNSEKDKNKYIEHFQDKNKFIESFQDKNKFISLKVLSIIIMSILFIIICLKYIKKK